jgi:hypothetical protein
MLCISAIDGHIHFKAFSSLNPCCWQSHLVVAPSTTEDHSYVQQWCHTVALYALYNIIKLMLLLSVATIAAASAHLFGGSTVH